MITTDTKELWNNTLSQIELEVSKATFNTWFKNTTLIKFEEGTATIGVPNQMTKDWFVDKYHKLVLRFMRQIADGVRAIEYMVVRPDEKDRVIAEAKMQPSLNAELPLQDLYINKDDNLNPRYTFDSFVVGPFNELAYAAAQAIVKNPGSVYNPLFIYGNTGHGKTHLIQSIGNYVKDELGKRVFYVTSEKFVLDYTNAVQSNQVPHFKEKYRKYDVLIMDDIQFLSKKEKTQEELFHLFNIMHENNRQIIFSSDKHPNYLQNMEDRLRSRFSAGMILSLIHI